MTITIEFKKPVQTPVFPGHCLPLHQVYDWDKVHSLMETAQAGLALEEIPPYVVDCRHTPTNGEPHCHEPGLAPERPALLTGTHRHAANVLLAQQKSGIQVPIVATCAWGEGNPGPDGNFDISLGYAADTAIYGAGDPPVSEYLQAHPKWAQPDATPPTAVCECGGLWLAAQPVEQEHYRPNTPGRRTIVVRSYCWMDDYWMATSGNHHFRSVEEMHDAVARSLAQDQGIRHYGECNRELIAPRRPDLGPATSPHYTPGVPAEYHLAA